VLNGAAVLLSCFGNLPAERSARLTGQEVSSGWVDKAVARVDAGLRAAGFDEAMFAALAAEDVLAADETLVNALGETPLPDPDPDGEADPGEKAGKQEDAKKAGGAPARAPRRARCRRRRPSPRQHRPGPEGPR
jgi:hypothetical protein